MRRAEITLLEAVNWALAYALRTDPEVVLLGEDIGLNGGVFRATQGLQAAYGAHRVVDTPLDENLIAGMSVGMAVQGLKPVAEIQFCGFTYPILDQIIAHATRMRHRTRGRLSCPLVIRAPYGAGIHAPEHHSESPETYFAHAPGLRVVVPGSPQQAYGLLLAAIQDPDPVIFLEPKRIYRQSKAVVADDGKPCPLDQAFVLKPGQDVTCIAWGAMLQPCWQAVCQVHEVAGIDVELIDLSTLKPWDIATVLGSVYRTGRVVVVHEAARFLGLGAEIAAEIAEQAWDALRAPVQRVTGYDTVVPLARLEQAYLPTVSRIADALYRVMGQKNAHR